MALVECKECGEQISTQADACPKCGAPSPAQQLATAGKGLMGCGCLLTILITIPALVFLLIMLSELVR